MWEKREGRERKKEKVERGEPAGGASELGQGHRHQKPLSFSSIAFGWPHSHYPSSNTLLCLRAALFPRGLVLWVLVPSWLNYNGKASRPLRKGALLVKGGDWGSQWMCIHSLVPFCLHSAYGVWAWGDQPVSCSCHHAFPARCCDFTPRRNDPRNDPLELHMKHE